MPRQVADWEAQEVSWVDVGARLVSTLAFQDVTSEPGGMGLLKCLLDTVSLQGSPATHTAQQS